jgi:hypothetical protein
MDALKGLFQAKQKLSDSNLMKHFEEADANRTIFILWLDLNVEIEMVF